MQFALCLAALVAVCLAHDSKHTPPKVVVYSSQPGEYGKDNVLICRASDFHPPDITIELLKNGQVIPNANQTDLAFKRDWRFHLTTSVKFTPLGDEDYICRVTHGSTVKTYVWDPNM